MLLNPDILVVPFSPELAETWDNIVNAARNGTFLHLRSFMDYHSDRFIDCSLVVTHRDSPIAVFPANREVDQVFSHSGLSFGGLLYGMNVRSTTVGECIFSILDYYRSMGIRKLHYKAIPYVFHKYYSGDDLYFIHHANGMLVRRDMSSVMKIANHPKVSESRMHGIKKSRKAQVAIKVGDFHSDFHKLLEKVLSRHNASPVHSPDEMKMLQTRFPDRIKLVGAFEGEELLAGTWLFHFDAVLHTQYLAVSDHGKNLGALDFLLNYVIEEASEGFDILSFGISTEDRGRVLNEGLIFQKEGFGARSIVVDHYEVAL